MLAEAEREPGAAASVVSAAPAAEAPTFAAELRLAEAVARGERAAATEFARRLLPVARRVTLALVGPVADADDLCQGALVELLGSAHTYAGRGPLEAWARRIIVRRSLRTLRSARRVQIVELGEAHVAASASDEPLHEHLPRAVDDYLAALPEPQRTALLLRHALGHTLVEIAEITGAPVPTVKSRVLAALTTIRRLIRRDLHLGQGPKQARPG